MLLTWLGHVSAGLARATRNPVSPMWVARNIRPVLQLLRRARQRPADREGRLMATDCCCPRPGRLSWRR